MPKQFKQKTTPHQSKPNQLKDKQQKIIYKGVFIADQRRKGKGARIKSESFPNKIEVRMKRDITYLHESEVEWVEVGRYNKKEGRNKNKNKSDSKQMKFKQKEEQKDTKKYVLKSETQNNQNSLESEPVIKEQSLKETHQTSQMPTDTEAHQGSQSQDSKKEGDRDDNSQSSESDEEKGEIENKQKVDDSQEKNQENDIVIIAEVKKEISNPFWNKPFVGIIQFIDNNNQKQASKFKEKGPSKSQVSRIMDDFYLDFLPIHGRLPVCQIQKNNSSQKLLEDYVKDNIKFDEKDKGGKIRNKILDEVQCLYALVKFKENYKGRIYVDLVKIIGKARTIDGECNCFLYQHELNDFQHIELEQKKQSLQLNISPIHSQFNELVFTIDPQTSTDLDDALSIIKVSQKEYEIGIHISDISSYLSSIPRQQIIKRTTSVYLPHSTFHMLPKHLVQIASLNPNVKRLAFSVFVRMNEQGEILESRLEKNVVMSRYKLSYEQAQAIIQGEMTYDNFKELHACTAQEYQKLVDKIHLLVKVGTAHRKKRLQFEIFDNDEIDFQLDQNKWPISFTVKSRFTAKKIIQEFMIIGNVESAKKLTAFDPYNSLIIHHPKPSDLGIRQFNEYFSILNYKFKFENSLSLQKDLLKVSEMANISESIKKLCYFKARRVQETATYKRYSDVEAEQGNIHFALGLRFYTHFTSPMRRFSDILVHQCLNTVVDSKVPKKQLLDKEIEQANWGRKNTKRLKRDLTQIYLCLMIYKTKKPIEAEGIVASFGMSSVSIYIPFLEMCKEIMWKDLKIDKVYKNKEDAAKLDVAVHYDRKSASKDIIWTIEKFSKFPIKVCCSTSIPLKLTLQFEIQSTKGMPTKIEPKSFEN